VWHLSKIAGPCGFIFCDASERVGQPGVGGTVKPGIGLYTIRDENQGIIMDFHKRERPRRRRAPRGAACQGKTSLWAAVDSEEDRDLFLAVIRSRVRLQLCLYPKTDKGNWTIKVCKPDPRCKDPRRLSLPCGICSGRALSRNMYINEPAQSPAPPTR
jgi:hypothetical protein